MAPRRSDYYKTLGFLAQKARFEAMVPQKARRGFEKKYEKLTHLTPTPGEDNYYLHPNPNVNKWGPELRMTFEATPEQLKGLAFESDISVVRGSKEGEYRINNNKFIWSLWELGFRNGNLQDPKKIKQRIPSKFHADFDSGLESAPRSPLELDEEGMNYSKWLEENGFSGEGREHLLLKLYVAHHPTFFGLYTKNNGILEFMYVSGDRCDVVFDLEQLGFAVVEVKNGERGELVKGIYQAVKYRALMKAQKGHGENISVKAFLIAYEIPQDIEEFARKLEIRCHIIDRERVRSWAQKHGDALFNDETNALGDD